MATSLAALFSYTPPRLLEPCAGTCALINTEEKLGKRMEKGKDCRGKALSDQRVKQGWRFGFGDLESSTVRTGCTFPPQRIPWWKRPGRGTVWGTRVLSEARAS